MNAPYDPFPAITMLAELLNSANGQEALNRYLGEHPETLDDIKKIWEQQPKAEAPFLGEE